RPGADRMSSAIKSPRGPRSYRSWRAVMVPRTTSFQSAVESWHVYFHILSYRDRSTLEALLHAHHPPRQCPSFGQLDHHRTARLFFGGRSSRRLSDLRSLHPLLRHFRLAV